MQLNQDAHVFVAKGKEVGHLDRVVIDPKTNEITHIVMRQGALLAKAKVVPIDMIAGGEGDRIILYGDANGLADLPDFEETHYVLSDKSPESFASGPIGVAPPGLYAYPPHASVGYTKQTQQNIPADTVAVKEGARVMTSEGKEVGHVEQVLTRSGEDYVTHFLISKGVFLKVKKMIPVGWIQHLDQNEIHLAVDEAIVEKLPVIEFA